MTEQIEFSANDFYDPMPYVLPDEDDFFSGQDDRSELRVVRCVIHDCCCFFFYAPSGRVEDADLMIYSSNKALYFSISEEAFVAATLRRIWLLRWFLAVVELLVEREGFWRCWELDSPGLGEALPALPEDWRLVIG